VDRALPSPAPLLSPNSTAAGRNRPKTPFLSSSATTAGERAAEATTAGERLAGATAAGAAAAGERPAAAAATGMGEAAA